MRFAFCVCYTQIQFAKPARAPIGAPVGVGFSSQAAAHRLSTTVRSPGNSIFHFRRAAPRFAALSFFMGNNGLFSFVAFSVHCVIY